MLADAEQRGYVSRNPTAGLGKLAERPSERGVLELCEVRALFAEDAVTAH